ncbi:MAG: ABC transporter ATP-binding protein [Rhodospirillaceae bacterium]|nr:ABC transporter ATP-binding protein [Rhodospirillaceae bacterium]
MLKVSNLNVYYHRVIQALKGVSFEIPDGKIISLLGSNGAGKSTALNAISNILSFQNGEITEGKIEFNGNSTFGKSADKLVKSGMAYVREGRKIFSDLTVNENLVAASYALEKSAKKNDYEQVYDLFKPLYSRRKEVAGYLSGGEQQMLAFGRALLGNPKLLLMDEPSLGLAPVMVGEIFKIISKINKNLNTTILLVEQNANLAFKFSDYIYIMESGKIVIEGKVDKLRKDSDVQEFYLGVGNDSYKSYRDIKHYKRRKRWLS